VDPQTCPRIEKNHRERKEDNFRKFLEAAKKSSFFWGWEKGGRRLGEKRGKKDLSRETAELMKPGKKEKNVVPQRNEVATNRAVRGRTENNSIQHGTQPKTNADTTPWGEKRNEKHRKDPGTIMRI